MNRLRSRSTPGSLKGSNAALFVAACILLLTSSCKYGFSGGGGFPSDIRTIFIEPFENQTVQVELDQQLFRKLQEKVPRALGARPAGEENADAVIRGKILRYDDVGQNYRPGAQGGSVDVLTYQVSITVAVEIIDRKRNVVLWESQGLVGRGDYRRDTQKDTDGREIALNLIIQQIVDGAQSQW